MRILISVATASALAVACVIGADAAGLQACAATMQPAPISDPDDWKWRHIQDLQGIDGEVYALVEYGGLLMAGGQFEIGGSTIACNIAAWDGSSWSPLGSGTDGPVYALSVYAGCLVAGGSFTLAGGTSAGCIARWDGGAWKNLGLGVDDEVYALAVYDGKLITGGTFTTAGAVSANNIAARNGSTWAPSRLESPAASWSWACTTIC